MLAGHTRPFYIIASRQLCLRYAFNFSYRIPDDVSYEEATVVMTGTRRRATVGAVGALLLADLGTALVVRARTATHLEPTEWSVHSIDERSIWAFDVLAEEGYEYSSSIYPIKHDHYGMPNASRFAHRPGDSLIRPYGSGVAVYWVPT